MNSSRQEQFEKLYTRLWGALHRQDDPDLSQHERQLLHHIPTDDAISLTDLATHLALPKSSASVLVKNLGRRGFLVRARDEADERRLRIELTDEGRARLAQDTVLDQQLLSAALEAIDAARCGELLERLGELADAAERVAPADRRWPRRA